MRAITARRRHSHDPELAQAITRIGVLGTALAYCAGRGAAAHGPQFVAITEALGAYMAYALVHLLWVAARPGSHPARRVIGILGDQLACTTAFFIGGETAFAAFGVYLWSSVGNGMRYGARYMHAATIMGFAGFTSAAIYHRLIVTHSSIVIGILVAMATIPLFVHRLTRQIELAHELLKRQARELEFEATHDRLTGLANRAVFFDELERVIARADREHGRCAVVYFDIDGFKGINDSFGHLAGDRWLQRTAAAIAVKIRKGDLFCRLAGDEFVVLTEHAASEDAALRIAEMIQATVRSVDEVDGNPVHVSASIGIALYPCTLRGENATAVAHRADLAMYCAKRSGRGRATIYEPGLAFPDSMLRPPQVKGSRVTARA